MLTLETAHRLFDEARLYSSGRAKYMSEDSEIRRIALDIYRHSISVMHLQRVCDDIFYLVACEARQVEA